MVIYRIQDRDGRGPFQPGLSRHWADADFADGVKPFQTWEEEFGRELIQKNYRPDEWYGSGVRHYQMLYHWFSSAEIDRLLALGFHIVEMTVDRILAESPAQVVFARRKPLTDDVQEIQPTWSNSP